MFDMAGYTLKVNQAVDYIKEKTGCLPEICIILGSGLSSIAQSVEIPQEIDYAEIPGFSVSTAPGHKGQLIFGKMHGRNVVLMNGRFHYYEGYSMKEVTFPIRVMQMLGVKYLFVTNAAGGLNPEFQKANPCIITDHINFFGDNPLVGPNNEQWGPRFPDMSECYSKDLIEEAEKAAKRLGINIFKGVYLGITGPTFETPAELRMMREFGADLVGMSTIPEVIVARHAGIKVLGISCITDMAIAEDLQPLTAQQVIDVANSTGKKIAQIIMEVVKSI
ncbi:MAG TPA: purine-nucleoside phosphorylase [Petrotogaceae bacterium]|jgi:purine-nucleoside phosphorylase|nr:purine-nucleoside phosphorylase [Petrotogaceae bacterium]HPO28357.1 purine-nucleoside phosphorylase [Petrotogaceae bacterium]HQF33979.1 purine-nucleoside phosphorylase [Petrotogaceae bacterium]HQH32090.1 purine-nucleoside phosphorylase [Petrotogaceae bacterium]HQI78150.1 purine-nucleoside phosphorylase [Petrotogaceae bacterium]